MKRKSTETVAEEAQILDLSDKDFKSDNKNMCKELRKTMSKESKKGMRIISYKKEDTNKKTEIKKNIQIWRWNVQ